MTDPGSEIDQLMAMPVDELARGFAQGMPESRSTELRKHVLDARLLAASIETANATRRLAKWTLILAVATVLLAVATVVVALVTDTTTIVRVVR